MPVILSVGPYFSHTGQTGPEGFTHTGPSARFQDFIEGADLFDEGYAFVMVDLRGFGGSTGCLDWAGPGQQADEGRDRLGGQAALVHRRGGHVRQVDDAAAQLQDVRPRGHGGGDDVRLGTGRKPRIQLDRATVRGDGPGAGALMSWPHFPFHARPTARSRPAVPIPPPHHSNE
ncbi:hypothetical protein SFUMM280S_02518 [Streptomyces fumanus]